MTVKNFMSVGSQTQAIVFSNNDLTLVLGENLDQGGDDASARNGTGKTTIVNALCYALYGQPLTPIKKVDMMINDINKKNMLVTVDFEVNGVSYHIERGRKPNVLKFTADENEISEDESQGDSRETQQMINNVIGVSYDMFKHIIVLSSENEPFLKMKAADQREIIEQLLGITMLSDKAEELKALVKETKGDIQAEEHRVNALREANEKIKEQIDGLKRRQSVWTTQHNKDIDEVATLLEELNEIDIEAELKAHVALADHKAKALQHELAEDDRYREHQDVVKEITRAYDEEVREEQRTFDAAVQEQQRDYNEAVAEHERKREEHERAENDKQREYKESQREHAALKKELDHLERELQSAMEKHTTALENKCPECGQEVHDDEKIKEYADTRVSLEEDCARKRKEYELPTVGEPIVDEFDAKLENDRPDESIIVRGSIVEHTLPEFVHRVFGDVPPTTIYSKESEATEHRVSVTHCEKQLIKLSDEPDPYTEQINEMTEAALEEVSFDKLDEMTALKDHQEFLLKLLVNKDSFIRKQIVEQNLAFLNTRLDSYLEKTGLPHQVVFKNDLSVEITKLGREKDFGNLSRGERNRLVMSLSWAFRDVYENLYEPISLVFVDELLDTGMDGQGVQYTLEVLKTFARERGKSVWLISHKEELMSNVNNVLMVTKESEFTTYGDEVEVML